MNLDFERFGNSSERITARVYSDRQEVFLFDPSSMPLRQKVAIIFFAQIPLLFVVKSAFSSFFAPTKISPLPLL